jgi:hypothetical protein
MSDWDTFQEKYRTASPEIRDLIESEQIPLFAQEMQRKYNSYLINSLTTTNCLVDFILGILPSDEITKKMVTPQTSPEVLHNIENDVVTYAKMVYQAGQIEQESGSVQEISWNHYAEPAGDSAEAPIGVPRYQKPLPETPGYDDASS